MEEILHQAECLEEEYDWFGAVGLYEKALSQLSQDDFSRKGEVLYLDENGKYKSHEPEPVTIVVKEMGIKSWLKGER